MGEFKIINPTYHPLDQETSPDQVSRPKRRVLPFYGHKVMAGFVSPAEDWMDEEIDFNEVFGVSKVSVYTVQVEGDSMIDANITSGDYLIVDRSKTPYDRCIIVAVINNEFTCKVYRYIKGRVYLFPKNPKYRPIEIKDGDDFMSWGVVTHVIYSTKNICSTW